MQYTAPEMTARQKATANITPEQFEEDAIQKEVMDKLANGESHKEVMAWVLEEYNGQFDFQKQVYAMRVLNPIDKAAKENDNLDKLAAAVGLE